MNKHFEQIDGQMKLKDIEDGYEARIRAVYDTAMKKSTSLFLAGMDQPIGDSHFFGRAVEKRWAKGSLFAGIYVGVERLSSFAQWVNSHTKGNLEWLQTKPRVLVRIDTYSIDLDHHVDIKQFIINPDGVVERLIQFGPDERQEYNSEMLDLSKDYDDLNLIEDATAEVFNTPSLH